MVGHDGIGGDFYGKVLGQVADTINDPLFTVRVVDAGMGMDATQPGSLHTLRDEVVVHGHLVIDQP